MARIYLISDTHFSDYKGMVHDLKRSPPEGRFKTTEEMNAAIIANWNNIVKSEDIIFILGDFAWLKNEMVHYSNQLNGNKCFILGNHDFEDNRWWLKEEN